MRAAGTSHYCRRRWRWWRRRSHWDHVNSDGYFDQLDIFGTFLFHRGENADVRDATSAATTHDETDSQVAKRTGEASGVGEHESAGGRFHRRVR